MVRPICFCKCFLFILGIMPIEKTYRVETGPEGLHITLRPNRPLALKFGLGVYALVYLTVGLMLVNMIRMGNPSYSGICVFTIAILVLLGAAAVPFLIARSFVRRLTEQESMKVTATQIIITLSSLFGSKDKVFPIDRVKEIGVAGEEDFTPHPLEDNNAAVQLMINERLIRYQITDGNMYISDGKTQVRFGKEIPSWDAEEIVTAIEQYTGRTFLPRPPGPEEEYWR